MNFECHITIHPRYIEQALTRQQELGFKVSEITGDERFGDQAILGYITFREPTYSKAKEKMAYLKGRLGYPILREKIEHILYDSLSMEATEQWEDYNK